MTFLPFPALASATEPAQPVERPLAIAVPGAAMAGSAIDTPAGAVVLFISGSGPTDRDGNSRYLRNDAIRLLAWGLAAHGFASVRFDKRFSGETRLDSQDETQVTLDRLSGDAGNWLRLMRKRYPGRPVALLGHSEGGIVALHLSQRVPVDALVLLAVPGRPPDEVAIAQFEAAGAPPATVTALRDALARLKSGAPVGDVPHALAALLRPGIYPYWRSVLTFDAPLALSAFAGPALLVYGGRDLQVSLIDGDRFARARPDSSYRAFAAMNHILRSAPPDRAGNIALYQQLERPLEPGLVDAVAEFLARQAPPR